MKMTFTITTDFVWEEIAGIHHECTTNEVVVGCVVRSGKQWYWEVWKSKVDEDSEFNVDTIEEAMQAVQHCIIGKFAIMQGKAPK